MTSVTDSRDGFICHRMSGCNLLHFAQRGRYEGGLMYVYQRF